jgi:hypothetical protein
LINKSTEKADLLITNAESKKGKALVTVMAEVCQATTSSINLYMPI